MSDYSIETRTKQEIKGLDGFEHVHRYWDKDTQRMAARIKPGEYFVSMFGEPISTVLGSCVSVCVRDRIFGIGGMNHIMLPARTGTGPIDDANRYGAFAMEALINTVLANGGRRKNLEVKVFGGGSIIGDVLDIGQQNIDFVMQYLAMDDYAVLAQDVGGDQARKVIYFPDVGRVRVRKLEAIERTDVVVAEERAARQSLPVCEAAGDIELFD